MQIQHRRLLLSFTAALCELFVFISVCGAQKSPQAPKPKVRTVTAFINIERGRYQIQISEAVDFLKKAKAAFEKQGYTVQTLRVVTQPFPEYTKGVSRADALQFFKNLDGIAQQDHLMISIGPAYLSGDGEGAQADLLAEALKNTQSLYGTVVVANSEGVDWPAVKSAAGIIKTLADNTPHSEGNFRFAAIANVPAYSPFFPAAYHAGAGNQFAVGLESANTVAAAFRGASDLADARRRLIDLLYPEAFDVEHISVQIAGEQGWSYLGQDLSPAPSVDASIGAAIELLSKQPFGSSGTLTAVGTITSALKEIGARRVGYSGLMLPVLEDPTLAKRWNAGLFSVDALMSYSAVCGTGLDTVPLAGDTSVDTLARMIGDVATLSVKWNKPLSVRLLPVAGKRAGDHTEFTDPRLINGIIQPSNTK
jgi:uncharacterized protein (UPF0210 family)